MIKRYKIKDSLKIKEAISIENLKDLGDGGFIVLILNTINPDDVADLMEEIDSKDIQVPVIVQTCDTTVAEVVDTFEGKE